MAKPDKRMAKKIADFWNWCNAVDPEWIASLNNPSYCNEFIVGHPSTQTIEGVLSTGHKVHFASIGGFLNGLIGANDECAFYKDMNNFLHVNSLENVEALLGSPEEDE